MILGLAMFMACGHHTGDSGSGPPPTIRETGWFPDSATTDAPPCVDTLDQTTPMNGEGGWYWRDPLSFTTTTSNASAYSAKLTAPDGTTVPTTISWADTTATVTPASALTASTTYELDITDCQTTTPVTFTTSGYGAPITAGASSLIGGTWTFDLSKAKWDKPAGFGTILALYFTTPILTGVQWADSKSLDLIGAEGYSDASGNILQYTGAPTWDYPTTSFVDAPFFQATAASMTVQISGVDVKIYNFALQATFSADGSAIGGGIVTGLGDTRDMGPLLGQPDNDNAVCSLAATVGAICEACPDEQPYCLQLSAQQVEGMRLPGVTLRRVQ
jgi:hypothetical protein